MRFLLTFCVFVGLASALCNCFTDCCTSDADCTLSKRCRIGGAQISTSGSNTNCDASLTYGVCVNTEPVDPCANFDCVQGTPTPSGGTCYCRVETPCPFTARVTSPLDSALTVPICCDREPVTCNTLTQYQKDCWSCGCKEGFVAASVNVATDPTAAGLVACVTDPCASTTCQNGQICVPEVSSTGRMIGKCIDSCPGKRLADGSCCPAGLMCPAIACVEPLLEDPTACCPSCICPAASGPNGRGNCTSLDPCRQCTSTQTCQLSPNGAYACVEKTCGNGTSLLDGRCCPDVCTLLAPPLCAPGYTLVRAGCCEWSCRKDGCDLAQVCPACAPGYSASPASTACCPDCTCDGTVDANGRCLPDPCANNPCPTSQRCEAVLTTNTGVASSASYICVDPNPTPCASTDCGRAPALSIGFCPGSCDVTGQPQCVRQEDGTCGWKWSSVCPPDACSTVRCPAGTTCQSHRTIDEKGVCTARPTCVPDSCAVAVNGECCPSLSAEPVVAGAVDPLWACPQGIRTSCDNTDPCACPLPERVTTCWDGSRAGASLEFCASTNPTCPCSKTCPPSPCDNCAGLCALVLDPSCAPTTEVRPDCVCAGGGADCCPSTATSATAVPPTDSCRLIAQCLEVKQSCAATTCPAGSVCVERGARAECVRQTDGCTTFCPSTTELRDTSCGFLSPIVDANGCYLSCGAEVCSDLPRATVTITVSLETATSLSAAELEAALTSTIANHCPSERPACVSAAFSIQVSSVSEDGRTVVFTVALTDAEASEANKSALETAARSAIQPSTSAAAHRSLF